MLKRRPMLVHYEILDQFLVVVTLVYTRARHTGHLYDMFFRVRGNC